MEIEILGDDYWKLIPTCFGDLDFIMDKFPFADRWEFPLLHFRIKRGKNEQKG